MTDTTTDTPSPRLTGAALIKDEVTRLPDAPGVYRMIGEGDEVLYVGKAKSLKKRVVQYAQGRFHTNRIAHMVDATRSMEFVTTRTEADALLLEINLIKSLKPRFNVLLRDDKSFPEIVIRRDHDAPQLRKHRGAHTIKGDYFGPFASAWAVNRTLNTLQKAFLLRSCSDSVYESRDRPCMLHQIKRCAAPCTGLIGKDDYQALVDQAEAFLRGKSRAVIAQMAKAMEDAAEDLEFERADESEEEGVTEEQRIITAFLGQFYDDKPIPRLILANVQPAEAALLSEAFALKSGRKVEISVPKRGEKADLVQHALTNAKEALGRKMAESGAQTKLLAGVCEAFKLEAPPERIEVYDNSHIQGTNAVGGMIVASPEGFMKGQYRKFNIKSTELTPGDDYGMMKEVLRRRFARLVKEEEEGDDANRPDLVLVDGGKGQLDAAIEIMADLGVDDIAVVGVAKGPDRDAGLERFFLPGQPPFMLEPKSPVLYYLQRLRDEAHRFAIGAHRTRRSMDLKKNPLDEIEGVGPGRKKALLHAFGSAKGVGRASVEDLVKVEGVSQALAERIHGFFRKG